MAARRENSFLKVRVDGAAYLRRITAAQSPKSATTAITGITADAATSAIVRGAVESSAAASLCRCGNAQRRGVTCVRVELRSPRAASRHDGKLKHTLPSLYVVRWNLAPPRLCSGAATLRGGV